MHDEKPVKKKGGERQRHAGDHLQDFDMFQTRLVATIYNLNFPVS